MESLGDENRITDAGEGRRRLMTGANGERLCDDEQWRLGRGFCVVDE